MNKIWHRSNGGSHYELAPTIIKIGSMMKAREVLAFSPWTYFCTMCMGFYICKPMVESLNVYPETDVRYLKLAHEVSNL